MQFAKKLRDRVRSGEITCSVRIWQQPRVKPGGRYRMDGGSIVVTRLERIEPEAITPALARRSGFADVDDLLATAVHGRGEHCFLVEFRYEEA